MGAAMKQSEIQIWNDAVTACKQAAMDAVMAMEREAGDGMPNPARRVICAIANVGKAGDDRNTLSQEQSDAIMALMPEHMRPKQCR